MTEKNPLKTAYRKHKRKQKYPMSIFPDYKKGAEMFNKNSTAGNQTDLSSGGEGTAMGEAFGVGKPISVSDVNGILEQLQFEKIIPDNDINFSSGDLNFELMWLGDSAIVSIFRHSDRKQIFEKEYNSFNNLHRLIRRDILKEIDSSSFGIPKLAFESLDKNKFCVKLIFREVR